MKKILLTTTLLVFSAPGYAQTAPGNLREFGCDPNLMRPVMSKDGETVLYWTGGKCDSSASDPKGAPSKTPGVPGTPTNPGTPDDDGPGDHNGPGTGDSNGDNSSDDSNGGNSDEKDKKDKKDEKDKKDKKDKK